MKILIGLTLMAMAAGAQTPHMPRGTATDISKADVEATVQKTASAAVSDQAIRVVSINGEYNAVSAWFTAQRRMGQAPAGLWNTARSRRCIT
jgi:hypothetical protein